MKIFEEYIIPINETAKDYDEMFVGIIRRQPVLIRCKDCKYWGADVYRHGCRYAVEIMTESDYCSMAERKEE